MNEIRHRLLMVCIVSFLWGPGPWALAQQTTEQFIPIGQSPGVSGRSSYIGRIVAVDESNRTITLAEDDGERRTLRMAADTNIWVDRSRLGRSSTAGSYADCEVGRRAEIAMRADELAVADWIKVEAN